MRRFYFWHSIDYQEKYKYITEKLSVLRTEMDDLKKEDGQSRYDIIHDDNARQGSTKRKLLDQVATIIKHLDVLASRLGIGTIMLA